MPNMAVKSTKPENRGNGCADINTRKVSYTQRGHHSKQTRRRAKNAKKRSDPGDLIRSGRVVETKLKNNEELIKVLQQRVDTVESKLEAKQEVINHLLNSLRGPAGFMICLDSGPKNFSVA